jgi:hypothetical protein
MRKEADEPAPVPCPVHPETGRKRDGECTGGWHDGVAEGRREGRRRQSSSGAESIRSVESKPKSSSASWHTWAMKQHRDCERHVTPNGQLQEKKIRLSATVTPKFFPLYHFFPLFSPLFFHLPQRFPLNTPPIPHYHYKISFSIPTINFLSTNNYSWTHSTVFRVMNSDTLDLGGERRRPTRRGRCRGTAAAIRCPLQPSWKGRGSGRVDRCGQS